MLSDVELLRRAARRLRRTGWQQGSYGSSEGPNCMVGALMHEGWDTRRFDDTMEFLQQRLQASPTFWNDCRGRTPGQVIWQLYAAARELEARR